MKNSYAMFTVVVYFYEQSRTIPPKIMTHWRESRCKSRALHAACNKFRSAAAVARTNATAGPGTQIRTHSRSRRVHPLSLSLFFSLFVSRNFFPSSESKFPIVTLSKISRYDRNVKHCSTHGDQLKFYFRWLVLYLRFIGCFILCSELPNIY